MSQENVEVVRRAFADSLENWGVWFEAADPDIRVYPRPAEPDAAKEYRGLDGLMDYLVNWYSQWDEYEVEPIEFLDAGDRVLVVLRERGRIVSSGMEVEENFSHSFAVRAGKVIEWRAYDSHEEALAAVGLSG